MLSADDVASLLGSIDETLSARAAARLSTAKASLREVCTVITLSSLMAAMAALSVPTVEREI